MRVWVAAQRVRVYPKPSANFRPPPPARELRIDLSWTKPPSATAQEASFLDLPAGTLAAIGVSALIDRYLCVRRLPHRRLQRGLRLQVLAPRLGELPKLNTVEARVGRRIHVYRRSGTPSALISMT